MFVQKKLKTACWPLRQIAMLKKKGEAAYEGAPLIFRVYLGYYLI
jgi:hypothetical protein